MEKKLTDEEIAQALLQNIEYSKTLTYFDKWGNHKAIMITDIIDFIHRLQDEKQKVIQDYYSERQTCDEQKDIIAEQKSEIERLTEELKSKTKEFELTEKALIKNVSENVELQKQVDELKEERYYTEQDTAKEIYTQMLEWIPVGEDYHWFITTLENWLKEKYGVEVE